MLLHPSLGNVLKAAWIAAGDSSPELDLNTHLMERDRSFYNPLSCFLAGIDSLPYTRPGLGSSLTVCPGKTFTKQKEAGNFQISVNLANP